MSFRLPRPFWRPKKSRARRIADDAMELLRDRAAQAAEGLRAAGDRVSLPRPWHRDEEAPEEPRRWRGVVIRVPRGTRVRVAPRELARRAGEDPESWAEI